MSNSPPITVFTYINALNDGKKMNVNPKIYNKFLVTRFYSLFVDTILLADLANTLLSETVSAQDHYNFYLNMITFRKRFSKWWKAEKNDPVEHIMKYFNMNREKAMVALSCLKQDELKQIEEWNHDNDTNE